MLPARPEVTTHWIPATPLSEVHIAPPHHHHHRTLERQIMCPYLSFLFTNRNVSNRKLWSAGLKKRILFLRMNSVFINTDLNDYAFGIEFLYKKIAHISLTHVSIQTHLYICNLYICGWMVVRALLKARHQRCIQYSPKKTFKTLKVNVNTGAPQECVFGALCSLYTHDYVARHSSNSSSSHFLTVLGLISNDDETAYKTETVFVDYRGEEEQTHPYLHLWCICGVPGGPPQ